MTRLILASGSAIRAKILTDIGLDFEIVKPDVDEDVIKNACAAEGLSLNETVLRLSDAKALAAHAPDDAIVIGSDQILEHHGRAFDKPRDLEEARGRLTLLQNDVHALINGVSVVKAGAVIYRNVEISKLFMRRLKDDEITAYLADAGEVILSSVGGYQIERFGARLFDRVEGDHYAILGLALFPLLAFLRDADLLDY